ncbi:MAG: hypothetical protein OXQ92_00185 [Boseongicola sp.]|nr:hypothetical protein [Boseongicola sp.]MDD9977715.1 hypothetical protein [Boseongicola sp.]
MKLKLSTLFASAFIAVSTPAIAAAPEPVTLDPINHQSAELQIRMTDGTVVTYTPAELESLPTYRITTKTPWRDDPAVFEGVLLMDLLKKHGIEGSAAIRVVAENEYTTSFDRKVWEAAPILVATRVDGRAHSRRARGPIQFVVASDDYEGSSVITEDHLVWMAAAIEVAE